jgi:hypothetical protein
MPVRRLVSLLAAVRDGKREVAVVKQRGWEIIDE